MADGFWSYVRADDQAEHGRISQLARDVAEQYQLLTAETISLFLDRDAIQWGENWRDTVDASLASVAFFIPVLTPRYFMSSECRRELQYFARKAEGLGMKDLVLPLLYVDFPLLHANPPQDDLVTLVRTFQWEDWQHARFCEPMSERYRRAVARLASRLVEANRWADEIEASRATQAQAHPETTEESPGFLDLLAKAEEALPKWSGTTEGVTKEFARITSIVEESTAEIQRGASQGGGFGARLAIIHRLAAKLAEPVERVSQLSNEFTTLLHDVDEGFRLIISQAPSEAQNDASAKASVCTFFATVRQLSAAAHGALESTQNMIDTIAPLEKISRDLRPVLRRYRGGLTTIVEARKVTDEWVQLIDASGLECDGSIAGR